MEFVLFLILLGLIFLTEGQTDKEIEELRRDIKRLKELLEEYTGPECLKGGTTFLYRLKTEDAWRCNDPSCHRTDCPYKC